MLANQDLAYVHTRMQCGRPQVSAQLLHRIQIELVNIENALNATCKYTRHKKKTL